MLSDGFLRILYAGYVTEWKNDTEPKDPLLPFEKFAEQEQRTHTEFLRTFNQKWGGLLPQQVKKGIVKVPDNIEHC
jgi:hypothetical protein